MAGERFVVRLARADRYAFHVQFDPAEGVEVGKPTLTVDEPPPLGEGKGPNAARLLAAAVGNCLGASLLYCLERSRVAVEGVAVTVTGTLTRNAQGQLRIGGLAVELEAQGGAGPAFDRCLELFERFCVVTESVRAGLAVTVAVNGRALNGHGGVG